MGSVVGCTKNICFQKTTKEMSIDILQNNNLENIYTINSTSKNEQTKPALFDKEQEQEQENDDINLNTINIEKINNNELYQIESKNEESDEEEEEKEELKNDNINNNNDNNNNNNNFDKKDMLSSFDDDKYQIHTDKIKLIQRMYRDYKNRKNISDNNKINNNDLNKKRKKSKNNPSLLYKRYLSKSQTSKNNKKPNNGKEVEEIISIDQSQLVRKRTSKFLKFFNFKAIEAVKSKEQQNTMILKNNKLSFLNLNSNTKNKNYLSILNDFGEKSFIKTSYAHKNIKLTKISTASKYKKEPLTKNLKDNIRGNFTQKNERIIKYQGGFLKKTKKKNGFGIITWLDNSKLKGFFESNELNGICRFYNFKYRSNFIGEYKNNKPSGFGVYSAKSFSMQGYWDSENLNGIAIEVWEDGTYFQGEYKDNKKNGIGLYRWPDGTIYQGEFKDGQMNGKGIILYSNDCIFSGEIKNGYMDGYGYFSWGNGSMYIGYYSQDIKNGFGIYVWDQKNFVIYIGFWEMGKQQGIGAKVNGNKIKYCLWNKGKISIVLKGLYEIDKYLTGMQKCYYNFFTPGYISKLKSSNFYHFNER